ncbi:MAG: Carbonic anhydrase precursor [Euryarchaeota archaeon ADurb.Bin165]|jgi:carbonic anhydrase/acetyltransferase-like protein (isoleucine patch superfamily)|nr:MAG: Carbonic anhydrase precursor [Euryarchaeota archaeon ADurb.Bin165]HQB99928.1 gamma carbonic anhydrase family protein [Methanospirillum sp.]
MPLTCERLMQIHQNIQNSAFIAPNSTIIGEVKAGSEISVWYGAVIRADKESITIGNRSNIQDNCVVHTSTGHPVTLGDDVSVGHGAILHGCTIGSTVLVGMGAVVLNGAVIGDNTIIGAGAVVTEGKEIPPGSLVLGLPGKVIRKISEEEVEKIKNNASEYVKLARIHAHE